MYTFVHEALSQELRIPRKIWERQAFFPSKAIVVHEMCLNADVTVNQKWNRLKNEEQFNILKALCNLCTKFLTFEIIFMSKTLKTFGI